MPSHRVTLISNANQTQKITFLLSSTATDAVFKAAKDKLRLKKPSRIFLPGGDEITDDITAHLQNGIEFLISCGEDYIGLRKITQPTNPDCEVTIIAKQSFVDPVAITQLHATATLPGMVQAVGMPDLHPGTKSPVGATFVAEGYIHPPLIGGDIGCGMAVYKTTLTDRDVCDSEVKKLADRLVGIEGPWDGNVAIFLSNYLSAEEIEEVKSWETSLGTIGGGNHFAELQQITEATEAFAVDDVVLAVHSGSRGLGQQILGESAEFYAEDEAEEYLRKHGIACRWAKANRDLIALRFLSRIFRKELSLDDIAPLKILDIWHNNVEQVDGKYIHRKGAAPATAGMVIVPGSRGTLSAYVQPIATSSTAFSLAHGAGRAQSRSSILKKLSKRYRPVDFQRTKLGGWVICEDKELIYEEAPEGYKDVECVIADLVDAGACRVIAWGMPRVSYKVRK
jgi:release factor H-coupled RctB family protein